jgi:hypothetical protein
VLALAGVNSFGTVPVTAHGVFMDFDGRAQAGPDIDTRGMLITAPDGTVTRYFTDVYPALTGTPPGAASGATVTLPGPKTGTGLPSTSRSPEWPAPAVLVLLAALVASALLASRLLRPPRICGRNLPDLWV